MDGGPSFFEIGVPDADRARAFYGKLFAWTFHEIGDTGETWIETHAVGIRGGVHGGDPDTGIEVYFRVDDIESAVQVVRQLGGEAEEPGEDNPAFGRFSRCRDDQGVRFGLHQAPGAPTS